MVAPESRSILSSAMANSCGWNFILSQRAFGHRFFLTVEAECNTASQMSWCSVIAKRSYILHYGSRAVAQPPRGYTNLLNQLATSAYRIVMVFTSVVVSYGLKKIPYVGAGLEFAFLCWVDS